MGRPRAPGLPRGVDASRLGRALALARASAQLTQAEAAAVSGVSQTVIIRSESGLGVPSMRTVLALARTYDTSVEAIAREAGL